MPTVTETLQGGRADLLSIGFVISLWSGSRALHVFMDTVSIMYGQTGIRGIIGSRVLSLSLYAGSILFGSVTFPLVLIGPRILSNWLPDQAQFVLAAYWPVVSVLALVGLTGLYHFATPAKSPFVRDMPGAVLAAVILVVASALLRAWAVVAIGGTTLFGPLTAPIIVLIWFYLIALAILIGAAFNAAIRRLWPPPEYRGPVVRASEWWEQRRSPEEERHTLTPVERPRDP
jgi:membrane protein